MNRVNRPHLHEELSHNPARVTVETRYGSITGGRALNGAAVFLEIPYAWPPGRFEDPKPLPSDFRYEEREYIQETAYAVQLKTDGRTGDLPYEDKVGRGKPTENPLFVNIVAPPSFKVPSQEKFPVRVFIHGGFLQFGSPHDLVLQAQYIAAAQSEVWVNVGFRLSAFGFLACDKPKLSGNYGFKDQWLAVEWVKANIEAFGGDPEDIWVIGHSAGAHSVHQLLHHVSCLPEGHKAPFHSAMLQSNAILTNPKTPEEHRPQFHALCRALKLNPEASDILATLRDPVKVPWSAIKNIIDSDVLGEHGTFRACLSEDWLSVSDLMTWQRSGGFAQKLRAHGVRSIVVGDLTEEWYLYAISHPIEAPQDIVPNLNRYFPEDIVRKMVSKWRKLPDDAGQEEVQRLYGEILSCGQVHLPVRLLARDLQAAGFPVLRYEIGWTPEQYRLKGYVTHGTDRLLFAFRAPALAPEQIDIAKNWLDRIRTEVEVLEKEGKPLRDLKVVLALQEDKTIGWKEDNKWDTIISLHEVLLGE